MSSDEIPFLLSALEAEPANWNTRRYIAEHYLRLGDESSALSLATTAPVAPDTEDHALFACQLAGGHSIKRAHQLIDSFLVHHPSSARAHLLKSRLYELQGLDAKAETHRKVALVLNPHLGTDGYDPFAVAPIQMEGFEEAVPVALPGLAKAAKRTTSHVVVAPIAEALPVDETPVPTVPGVAPIQPPTSPTSIPAAVSAEADEEIVAAIVDDDSAVESTSAIDEIPALTPDVVPLGAPQASLPKRSAEQIKMEGTGLVVTPISATEDPALVVAAVDSEGDEEPEDLVSQIVGRQTAMVAAMSGTVDEMSAKPQVREVKSTNDKVSSIAIAVVAHVVILGLFTLVAMNIPQSKPPEIYASVSSADSSEDMQANEIKKPQMQQTAPAPATQQVLTSSMFSDIAMPTVDTAATSAVVGMGAEMGMDFGMSFSPPGGGAGMSSIPPSMAGRCSMGQRMARLKESGATTKCESAVRKALRYLKENQNEDGSFGREYQASMTALVVLALLGHCETPDSVEFGETVTKATLFLMERAKDSDHPTGAIMSEGGKAAYENAICSYALAEMYTMTKASGAAKRIPRLESTMKKGIKVILEGQQKTGGWDYGYRQGNNPDGSVSGWQFQALKAASNTGESISGLEKGMEKAIEYMKRAQDPKGGLLYRVEGDKNKVNPGLAGVGALAFLMKGLDDAPETQKAFEGMNKYHLGKGNVHAYGWYYIMQAYFLKGGEDWKNWNEFAMPKILASQDESGFFKVNGGHGPKDPVTAAIYHTCLCTLMLEVYYRYLPTTQKNLG